MLLVPFKNKIYKLYLTGRAPSCGAASSICDHILVTLCSNASRQSIRSRRPALTTMLSRSAVEEKPGSAGSRKGGPEKVAAADGTKSPDPDLVQVKAGGYSKK